MVTQFHGKRQTKNIHVNFSIHYCLVHLSAIHPDVQCVFAKIGQYNAKYTVFVRF